WRRGRGSRGRPLPGRHRAARRLGADRRALAAADGRVPRSERAAAPRPGAHGRGLPRSLPGQPAGKRVAPRAVMAGPIHVLDFPGPALAAADTLTMLARFGGPAAIRVPGARGDRCRVAVTLLHGNEPSGARAAHRLLAGAPRPPVDLWIVFA